MSDTPRTDAQASYIHYVGAPSLHYVPVDFARNLERELACATRVVKAARALVAAEDAAPHGVRTTETSEALMNLDAAIGEWEAGR